MQTGTIVRRKANCFIPNEFWEKALAENPNGWGAAMVSSEDGKSFLQLNSAAEGMTLEFAQETMKAFPDVDIVFYLACSPEALSVEDLSPYILLETKPDAEDGRNPLVIGFFDGNFPGLAQAGSTHPPEYFLANKIGGQLVAKFDALDEDIDDLMENLKKDKFKTDLMLNSVSRCSIMILAANGESIIYENNDKSKSFDWGWVSNTHGYPTSAVKPPEKKEDKPKVAFPSRSTTREKHVPAEPKPAIAAAVTPPKTDTSAIQNYTVKKWRPVSGLSRNERKQAYKEKIGYPPKGWDDNIEIDVYVNPQGKIMTFQEVKALGLKAADVIALAKNPARAGNNTEVEQPEAGRVAPMATAEILPVMAPRTREHIKDYMKLEKTQKIIGENAEVIVNPAIVQGLEQKFADFARQLYGEKSSMDDFAKWDYEMMLDLAKTKPDGIAVMAWTFRNLYLRNRTQEIKAELVNPDVKPTVAFPKRKAG